MLHYKPIVAEISCLMFIKDVFAARNM